MEWQEPYLGTEEALVEFLTQLDVKVKDVDHSSEQTTKDLSLPGDNGEKNLTLNTEDLIREAKLVIDGEVVEEAPVGVEELTPSIPYDPNIQLSHYTSVTGEAGWQKEATQTTSADNPLLTACDPVWGAYTTWDTSAANKASQSNEALTHHPGLPSPLVAGLQDSPQHGNGGGTQATSQDVTVTNVVSTAGRQEKILGLPQPVPTTRPTAQEEMTLGKPQVLVIQRMPKVTSTIVRATPPQPSQPWPDTRGTAQISITPISPRPLESWSSKTRMAPHLGEGAVTFHRLPEGRPLENGVTLTPLLNQGEITQRRPLEAEREGHSREQETMVYQSRNQQGKMYRMAYRRTTQSQRNVSQDPADFPAKKMENRLRKDKKREQFQNNQQQIQGEMQQLLEENERLKCTIVGLRKRLLHLQSLHPSLRAAQEEVNSLRRITNSLRLRLFVSERDQEAARRSTYQENIGSAVGTVSSQDMGYRTAAT